MAEGGSDLPEGYLPEDTFGSDRYRLAIQHLWQTIPHHLTSVWEIVRSLFQDEIIDRREYEELRGVRDRMEGDLALSDRLLDVIFDKTDEELGQFMTILKDHCRPVYDIIEEKARKISQNRASRVSKQVRPRFTKNVAQSPSIPEEEVISSLPSDFNWRYEEDLPEGDRISILNLGRTGSGKSALGNLTLETNDFLSVGTPGAVTEYNQKVSKTVRGRKLTVVDTPGLMSRKNEEVDVNGLRTDRAVKEISKAIALSPEGFDVFCIVIMYPPRLTRETSAAVTMFLELFGEEVKPYGIIVFTGGDTYRREKARQGQTANFKDYIDTHREGDEHFRKLMDSYTGGWILIDNLNDNLSNNIRQRNELVTLIDNVRRAAGNKKYTNAMFQSVCEHREELKKNQAWQKMTFFERFAAKAKKAYEGVRARMPENCFPVTARVVLYPGITAYITQVQVGDKVLSVSKRGEFFYDEVYSVVHSDTDNIMRAKKVITRSHQLIGSKGHYIPVKSGCDDDVITDYTYKVLVDIVPGDSVLVCHDDHKMATEEEVIRVEHMVARGHQNLLTESGRYVVDGVTVTGYEENVHPTYAHALLAPVRHAYRYVPSLLAVLSQKRYHGMPLWAYGAQKTVRGLRAMSKWMYVWMVVIAVIMCLFCCVYSSF